MELRPLGNTGLKVSVLGLGTVKFGRNTGVNYPQGFTLPDDRTVLGLLELCRELGINLLDTAPAYGTSEARIGRLLTHREDWVLASKVGESYERGVSRYDYSAASTRASVERSLKRLRTDWLDMVLIHSDGNDEHILRDEDVLEELLNLKQAGLIRAVGMSTKTVRGGLLAVEQCDVVMATWHLGYQDELPVLEAAAANNKGVLIKKALASGHLAVDKAGEDSLTLAIAAVLDQPGVSSIIVGTINPQHLRHNAAVFNTVLEGSAQTS